MLLDNHDMMQYILNYVEFSEFLKIKTLCKETKNILFSASSFINYQHYVLGDEVPYECYAVEDSLGTDLKYIGSLLKYFHFKRSVQRSKTDKVTFFHINFEGHSSISMIPLYIDLYNNSVNYLTDTIEKIS